MIEIGQMFGALTVTEKGPIVARNRTWVCRCKCGDEIPVRQADLIRGHSRSCGCVTGGGGKHKTRSRREPHPSAHRFVKFIWKEIAAQKTSPEFVGKRAGVSGLSIRRWQQGLRTPRIIDIEAVVNALGYKIKIVGEDV